MPRFLALLLLPSVALLGGSLAVAAADTAERVAASDLPSVGQVADVYPVYSGGSRALSGYRNLFVSGRECVVSQRLFRADAGRSADYTTRSGRPDPYGRGQDTVHAVTYEFGSASAARAAVEKVAAYASRCQGEHRMGGVVVKEQPMSLPRLGDGAAGFKLYKSDPNYGTERSLVILARVGSTGVLTWIFNTERFPDRGDALALARTQVRVVS